MGLALNGYAGLQPYGKTVWQWAFGLLLFVTLCFVCVPWSPFMPVTGLDPSWRYGINQALAQGLVFGRDIVFTLGPYAGVFTHMFHPLTDSLIVGAALYLAINITVVAWLLMRRAPWQVQLVLVLLLAGLRYSQGLWLSFYPYMVAVWVFSRPLPCWQARWRQYLLLWLLLPFGLLALMKGTGFVMGVAITAMVAFYWVLNKQVRLALAVMAAPVVGLVLFWLLAGQPLLALLDYLLTLAPMISGYTEAMQKAGDPWHIIVFVVAALVLVLLQLADRAMPLLPRAGMAVALFGVMFLAYKGGFVRHDGHVILAIVTLLITSLLLWGVLPQSLAATGLLVAALAWGYIDASFQQISTKKLVRNVPALYRDGYTGLMLRWQHYPQLQQRFDRRLAAIRDKEPLPLVQGSVDIYPHNQAALLAAGMQWQPRPVFQTYSAYTSGLQQLNRQHLLADNPPRHLFFKVPGMDKRLPPAEDGPSWPEMLRRYQPVGMAGNFFQLVLRPQPLELAAQPLQSLQAQMGQQVAVPESSNLVLANITPRASLLGRAVNTLFKTSNLRITLGLANGAVRNYRLVSGVVAGQFVLSPLVQNTRDFVSLHSNPAQLQGNRVLWFTVVPEHSPALWQPQYDVQFSHMPLPPSPQDS